MAVATRTRLDAVRAAVVLALLEGLPAALVVETISLPPVPAGGGAVALAVPATVREAPLTDFFVNAEWPALVVLSTGPRLVSGAQQAAVGVWRGGIEIHYWDEDADADALAAKLDAYGAALAAIIRDTDRFAGAALVPETLELAQSETPEATANARAVGLRFDVTWIG